MKIFWAILGTLAVGGGLYFVYTRFIAPSDESNEGKPCTTPNGTPDDSIIQGGVCVKPRSVEEVAQSVAPDYFVNGNSDHDKQVFERGLECAKAFLYRSENNSMANVFYTLLATGGRNEVACMNWGVNCSYIDAINNLSQTNKQRIVAYLNGLNADVIARQGIPIWQVFANMAVGNKNMCSVILQDAYIQIGLAGTGSGGGKG